MHNRLTYSLIRDVKEKDNVSGNPHQESMNERESV